MSLYTWPTQTVAGHGGGVWTQRSVPHLLRDHSHLSADGRANELVWSLRASLCSRWDLNPGCLSPNLLLFTSAWHRSSWAACLRKHLFFPVCHKSVGIQHLRTPFSRLDICTSPGLSNKCSHSSHFWIILAWSLHLRRISLSHGTHLMRTSESVGVFKIF